MIDTTVKAGKLINITSGEYSDYHSLSFSVALKSFCPLEELGKFLESNPEQKEGYFFSPYAFLAYLNSKGLLMDVDSEELWLGDYGDTESITFRGVKLNND